MYQFIPERVRNQIFSAVNELIQRDRDCFQVDRSLIKQCLYVYEDLDIVNPIIVIEKDIFKWDGDKTLKKYDVWFESFEKHTKNYVKQKSNDEIVKYSAIEYINSSLKYLEQENERKNEYIHKNYHCKIDRINHKYLIEDNIQTLIKVSRTFYLQMASGIEHMIDTRKDSELKAAFKLVINHEPSLKSIALVLEPYIKKKGDSLFNDENLKKDPKSMIKIL